MHNNKMQTRDSKKTILKVKGEAEKKKRSQKSISKVQAKQKVYQNNTFFLKY